MGPFNLQMPVKVPLWLAVALKRRMKCSIRPPIWLTKGARDQVIFENNLAESLQAKKEEEKAHEDFIEMPAYFQEIANILLEQYVGVVCQFTR